MKTLTVATLALALLSLCSPVQAQWVQTNVPYGASISSFAVVPNGAGGTNLFVGCGPDPNSGPSGGVFLSTNSGESWTPVNTGLTDTLVTALAVSGTNLFAGTVEGGVYRSTNSGASWTLADSGLTNSHVIAFAVSGTNLFAGTGGGIFLSTNSGANWTPASTGLTDTYLMALAVSGTNLFAGTLGGGVFLSSDSGATWTPVDSGLTNTTVRAFAVSGANLFAGIYGGGVYLSTNGGTSWISANTGLPTNAGAAAIAVSGPNLFAGTSGGGVFISTNNGTSWIPASTGLTHPYVTSFAFSGTNLFAGTVEGGVWKRPLSELLSVPLVSSEFPTEFSLGQNYPNPFNPTTTIQYALPHRSHVTLTVYNTLGQQVAVLVNADIDAGYHEVNFNATNLTSGVYFYRLQAGSFVQTRKLLLIR